MGRSWWGHIFHTGKKASREEMPQQAPIVRTLWEQEFNVVERGLDESQVVAYVEEMKTHHSEAVEKLQRPRPISELAGKVIYEAEKLAQVIEEEERKRAAERTAEILLRAQERSKEITDAAESEASVRLQEATRASAEVVGEAKRRAALAEEKASEQVPQQMANIQAALLAAIHQEYGKIGLDLVDLERQVLSRTEGEQPQPAAAESRAEITLEEPQDAEVLQGEGAQVDLPLEAIEVEPQPTAEVSLVWVEPAESDGKTVESESEESGIAMAEPATEEHQTLLEEDETLLELPGSTWHRRSDSLGGTTWHKLSSSGGDTVGEEDYANMSRDEVKEKILESLQQAIELSGRGKVSEREKKRPTLEKQGLPGSELEGVTSNGDGDVADLRSDTYQGDLEFVMAPQKSRDEETNHLALLSALYMTVKKIPGASVLGMGGSEAEGNSIAVHFESPIHLHEVLKDVAKWEEEGKGSGVFGSRDLISRLRSGKGKGTEEMERKRILVTL